MYIQRGKYIGKWGARFLRGLESGGKNFINELESEGRANVVSEMESVEASFMR